MIKLNNKPANLSSYDVVFCDSLQALDWAYANGLPKSATIKTSSPAMLWKKAENFQNIESRWSVKELGRFQGDINKLIESVFDKVSSCNKFEREIALTASRSVYQFQKILYKAACLESDDFCNSRLFIRVNGKTGPAGNIMNSPWDKLLSSNKLFSVVDYRLQDDKWNLLTTQGVSLLRRLKIAGYETIIFRLALKVMDKLPRFIFNKELLMPDENELNIEVAARLIFKGVKLSKVELKHFTFF